MKMKWYPAILQCLFLNQQLSSHLPNSRDWKCIILFLPILYLFILNNAMPNILKIQQVIRQRSILEWQFSCCRWVLTSCLAVHRPHCFYVLLKCKSQSVLHQIGTWASVPQQLISLPFRYFCVRSNCRTNRLSKYFKNFIPSC